MNRNRLNRLEKSVGKQLEQEGGTPAIWRPEGGKIAIQESPFILERLRSLNREVVYSPYVFTAILVDQEDRDIVERVQGRFLYLKGLTSPIQGMPGIKFVGVI
jgi:hypothetical protein